MGTYLEAMVCLPCLTSSTTRGGVPLKCWTPCWAAQRTRKNCQNWRFVPTSNTEIGILYLSSYIILYEEDSINNPILLTKQSCWSVTFQREWMTWLLWSYKALLGPRRKGERQSRLDVCCQKHHKNYCVVQINIQPALLGPCSQHCSDRRSCSWPFLFWRFLTSCFFSATGHNLFLQSAAIVLPHSEITGVPVLQITTPKEVQSSTHELYLQPAKGKSVCGNSTTVRKTPQHYFASHQS